MAEAKSRRVQGAGVTLAVQESGPVGAPTIVLLHGYPDTHAVWDLVAARLAERFHVVTYDVRGAGASDSPTHIDAYALTLLMTDLHAVVDAASPGRPVHLVGHDWGSLQGWEAVVDRQLDGRLASYTSISGPSLDHVRDWTRLRFKRRSRHDLRQLVSQAGRSSYIAAFHTPGVQWAAELGGRRLERARKVWAAGLRRREGVDVDEQWPPPSFGHDLAAGMSLYRANIAKKLRRGEPAHTDVPVQLVVAERDPYVPPALLEGLDQVAADLRVQRIDAGHWVPRSHPAEVADLIATFVDEIEGRAAEPADGAPAGAGSGGAGGRAGGSASGTRSGAGSGGARSAGTGSGGAGGRAGGSASEVSG